MQYQQTLFAFSFLAWYSIVYSISVYLHAFLGIQLTLNSFGLSVVTTLKLEGGQGVAKDYRKSKTENYGLN